MKRKAFRAGVACGILLGITIIAYAITSLFFTKSETSKLSKRRWFILRRGKSAKERTKEIYKKRTDQGRRTC